MGTGTFAESNLHQSVSIGTRRRYTTCWWRSSNRRVRSTVNSDSTGTVFPSPAPVGLVSAIGFGRLTASVLALVFGQCPQAPLLLTDSLSKLVIDCLRFERAGLDSHVLPQSDFDDPPQRVTDGSGQAFSFRAVHEYY